MGAVVEFLQMISKYLRSSLFALMSVPGLIVSGIVGFVAFVVGMFTEFDFTTELVNKIDLAASSVAEQFGVLRQSSSPALDMLVSFLAVDTFVECMVLLVTVTVALVVTTFCTLLLGIVAIAGTILVIRGILKLIRVCTAGVADP